MKILKTIKLPKYGIWAMTKNKDPDKFIKQFNGIPEALQLFRKLFSPF